jgi:hypothetical protein
MPTATRVPRMEHPGAAGPNRSGRAGARWIAVVLTFVLTGVVAGGVAVLVAALGKRTAAPGCQVAAQSGSQNFELTADQAQNATIIAAVAFRLGLPDHAVTIGLATALRESRLVNLTYGDRDSLGLFQQRPSQGWGRPDQILDPVYAATAFYHHLEQVPGWESMPVTEAAQTVQHSAAPMAYAPYESEARAVAAAVTGEKPAAFACRVKDFSGVAPTASAVHAAANEEMGAMLIGAPLASQKEGWELASWAVGHAWRYHIEAVTFGTWRWSASSGGWVDRPQTGTAEPIVQLEYGS